MSDRDKNIELLKKLRALAIEGADGERDAALKRMESLMEKYGISEIDLTDDEESDHDFVYHSPYEKQILMQCMYKIAPEKRRYYYTAGKGKRSKYGIVCTEAEAVQIGIQYEFYKEVWAEESKLFLEAFIQKHAIFPAPKPGEGRNIDPETLRRMRNMMNGMEDKHLMPMLEGA